MQLKVDVLLYGCCYQLEGLPVCVQAFNKVVG